MALDPVPFLIGGGVEHSPEVVRQAMYDATGGAEGISSTSAYLVQAQATPNGSVRVAPGGATLLNRYPGGAGQSYTGVRNISQTSVTVTPTGSAGGRTDAVILRVYDPQFEGQPPADPNDFQYTRLATVTAPAGITRIEQLGLAYPAILLARITIPANTGTITSGMIKDLRELANPQRSEVLRARPLITADAETLTSGNPAGEWFPNAGGEQRIVVPVWATRALIEAKWMMVREPAGDASGQIWVEWGPFVSTGIRREKTQKYDFNAANTSDVSRGHWEVADDMYVPEDVRGTEQVFVMKGWLRAAVPLGARPQLDATSGVSLRVTFLQVPDPSTT